MSPWWEHASVSQAPVEPADGAVVRFVRHDGVEVLAERNDRGIAANPQDVGERRWFAQGGWFAVSAPVVVARDLLGTPPEWQERGLCSQTDPEAFFPEKGGSTREAKKICAGCEVRPECLAYALANGERYGIWGGMSERERRRLARRAA